MKKLVLPLVLFASLTACNSKPELRKEIKEFISQFSLSEAVKQYQTGGYISTKVTTEGETNTKQVIEMSYSLLDENHPTYIETTTDYENDVVTSTVEIRFVENEAGAFISKNGELKKSSVKECKSLITKFFYKKVDLDGRYHTQGFYYGDYLKEVAPALQQYVTIDQENELYIMDYSVTKTSDGITAQVSQNYSVNKWGMLVENHNTIESEEKKVEQDIYVNN